VVGYRRSTIWRIKYSKNKTEKGTFDNREWLEAEADEITEERERIEEVARIDGGTVDVDN